MASNCAAEVEGLTDSGVLRNHNVFALAIVQERGADTKVIADQVVLHEAFVGDSDGLTGGNFRIGRTKAEVIVHGDDERFSARGGGTGVISGIRRG